MPPSYYLITNVVVGVLIGTAVYLAGRVLVRAKHLSKFHSQWVVEPLAALAFVFFTLRGLLPRLLGHYVFLLTVFGGVVGLGISFTFYYVFVRRYQ